MLKKALTTACLLALAGTVLAAGVRVRTVEGIGMGQTREEAINAALTEAVSKVNGMTISATTASAQAYATEEMAVGDKAIELSSASSSAAKAVSTTTAGNVRSYQVISVESASNGMQRAKLSVDVSTYDKNRQTERLRIAVVDFKAMNDKINNKDLRKFALKLNQSIVSYLTSTRHFAVLDKEFEDLRIMSLTV